MPAKRKCPVFLIITVSFTTCFFIFYVSWSPARYQFSTALPNSGKLYKEIPKSHTTGRSIEDSAEKAMTCHIPRLNPFDPAIRDFISSPPPDTDCERDYPKLFRTNFESKLIHIRTLENASCCYKTVERKAGTDLLVRMSSTCFPIKQPHQNQTIPSRHEFISVFCNYTESERTLTQTVKVRRNHTDMFAFVPYKPKTESRIRKALKKLRRADPDSAEEDRLSVVILGLDAQSHMNFIRQMPISHAFLTRNLSAIGLRGYTKVGDNTFPNLVPVLTGLSVAELQKSCWNTRRTHFDDCPFIWKDFAGKGYRTSYAEDAVWMGMFNYEKAGFSRQPTDYYLNPFAFQMAKKIGHEVSGNVRLCYGPRLAFEVLLDYMVKTGVRFRNKAYFQFIWANSLFHDYLNYPKLGDELLALTLRFFDANGFFNNTALILLSDHGIRWGPIRSTYQGRLEERMPLAYFAFPPWFRSKYSAAFQNLALNSDRLTTPFDLHETLKALLNPRKLGSKPRVPGFSESRGISLFQRIPRNRTCELAGIAEHWCVCDSLETLSVELPLIRRAAKFVVSSLNSIISKFPKCAKLNLARVSSAYRKCTNGESGSDRGPLQITLVSRPGDAIYEATVSYSWTNRSLSWEMAGEISRLNLYRNQSSCISDYSAQRYCFCGN